MLVRWYYKSELFYSKRRRRVRRAQLNTTNQHRINTINSHLDWIQLRDGPEIETIESFEFFEVDSFEFFELSTRELCHRWGGIVP